MEPQFHTQEVTLVDGKTVVKIVGVGNIVVKIGNNTIRVNNALHVPKLPTPLWSVKQHCATPGHYFHVANGKATLTFPTFINTIKIGSEMTVNTSTPTNHEIKALYVQNTFNEINLPDLIERKN